MSENTTNNNAAQELRVNAAAVRISFTWMGTTKRLSADHAHEAADTFGASDDAISASKKLINTKDKVYKVLTTLRSRIRTFWKDSTLPFPEPGIRLLRQQQVPEFDAQMKEFRSQLAGPVAAFADLYSPVREPAPVRLGRLFDAKDYPETVSNLFAIEWEYPSVEPPDYLKNLNPALYEQERQRIAARFDQAVQMAESMFAEEFAKLVNHLQERLTDGPEGRKILSSTAIDNFREFFGRFQSLSVRSNPELDALVKQAEGLVSGVTSQALRTNEQLRQDIKAGIETLSQQIDQNIVTAPKRRISFDDGAELASEDPAVSTPASMEATSNNPEEIHEEEAIYIAPRRTTFQMMELPFEEEASINTNNVPETSHVA